MSGRKLLTVLSVALCDITAETEFIRITEALKTFNNPLTDAKKTSNQIITKSMS